jgi:hypothetical protein
MSRYFHGVVSRFSAGRRDDMAPTSTEIATAVSELARVGISHTGASQLVTGQSVTSGGSERNPLATGASHDARVAVAARPMPL